MCDVWNNKVLYSVVPFPGLSGVRRVLQADINLRSLCFVCFTTSSRVIRNKKGKNAEKTYSQSHECNVRKYSTFSFFTFFKKQNFTTLIFSHKTAPKK